MKKLKELKESRVEVENKIEALVSAAEKANLTKEQKAEWEALKIELSEIDSDIKVAEEIEEKSKEIAKRKLTAAPNIPGAPQDNASEHKELEATAKKFKVSRAFNLVMESKALDGVEEEVRKIAIAEAKEAGIKLSGTISIPHSFIKIGQRKMMTSAPLSVGTEGPDVVFTEYGGKVIPFLNPMPVADKLGVTFLQGLQGNVQWPRETGDLAFSFETETSDVDETTPTFDNVSISPKRFGGYVDVTLQMLQQSVFVVEPWLRKKLELRYAITVDQQIFNGSGAGNQTTGLFNMAGVNLLSTGSGSANNMTYAALLSMKRDTKIANARMGQVCWVTNAEGEFALFQTPLQAGGVEGHFILEPNYNGRLFAEPFMTSQIIPANFSEGGQTDLCGIAYSCNWGRLIAGFWGGIDLLVDPYTQRLGGKIRFVVNAFMDVDVEQPLEFAICKDWDATDLPALT